LKFSRKNSGHIKESVLLKQSSFSEINTAFNKISNENTFLSDRNVIFVNNDNISEKPSEQEVTPMKENKKIIDSQKKL